MEHTLHNHIQSLNDLCRCCGLSTLTRAQKRSRINPVLCSAAPTEILNLFDLDISKDVEEQHSQYLCRNCHYRIRNIGRKATVRKVVAAKELVTRSKFIWTSYNEHLGIEDCSSCHQRNMMKLPFIKRRPKTPRNSLSTDATTKTSSKKVSSKPSLQTGSGQENYYFQISGNDVVENEQSEHLEDNGHHEFLREKEHLEETHYHLISLLCRVCGSRSLSSRDKNLRRKPRQCKHHTRSLLALFHIDISTDGQQHSTTLCPACYSRIGSFQRGRVSDTVLSEALEIAKENQHIWCGYNDKLSVEICPSCSRYAALAHAGRKRKRSRLRKEKMMTNKTGSLKEDDKAEVHKALWRSICQEKNDDETGSNRSPDKDVNAVEIFEDVTVISPCFGSVKVETNADVEEESVTISVDSNVKEERDIKDEPLPWQYDLDLSNRVKSELLKSDTVDADPASVICNDRYMMRLDYNTNTERHQPSDEQVYYQTSLHTADQVDNGVPEGSNKYVHGVAPIRLEAESSVGTVRLDGPALQWRHFRPSPEHTEVTHRENLNRLCRLCGGFLESGKQTKNNNNDEHNHATSASMVLSLLGINVLEDNENTHSKFLCMMCYQTICNILRHQASATINHAVRLHWMSKGIWCGFNPTFSIEECSVCHHFYSMSAKLGKRWSASSLPRSRPEIYDTSLSQSSESSGDKSIIPVQNETNSSLVSSYMCGGDAGDSVYINSPHANTACSEGDRFQHFKHTNTTQAQYTNTALSHTTIAGSNKSHHLRQIRLTGMSSTTQSQDTNIALSPQNMLHTAIAASNTSQQSQDRRLSGVTQSYYTATDLSPQTYTATSSSFHQFHKPTSTNSQRFDLDLLKHDLSYRSKSDTSLSSSIEFRHTDDTCSTMDRSHRNWMLSHVGNKGQSTLSYQLPPARDGVILNEDQSNQNLSPTSFNNSQTSHQGQESMVHCPHRYSQYQYLPGSVIEPRSHTIVSEPTEALCPERHFQHQYLPRSALEERSHRIVPQLQQLTYSIESQVGNGFVRKLQGLFN